MRFLVDANLPTDVSEVLKADGHDVRDVRHASPPLPDGEVYALAKHEDRVLLTRDLDFSNPLSAIRQKKQLASSCVVLEI